MSEAVITCRICEDEEGCSVGWDLYEFRKSNLSDQHEHNICDECVDDILVSVFKGEIDRLGKDNHVFKSTIIIKYLKDYIQEINTRHEELDRSFGNRN